MLVKVTYILRESMKLLTAFWNFQKSLDICYAMSSFNRLPLVEKYTLLSTQGKLLKTFIREGRKTTLYIMDNKYYELRYDEAGDLIDEILEINASSFFNIYLQDK